MREIKIEEGKEAAARAPSTLPPLDRASEGVLRVDSLSAVEAVSLGREQLGTMLFRTKQFVHSRYPPAAFSKHRCLGFSFDDMSAAISRLKVGRSMVLGC